MGTTDTPCSVESFPEATEEDVREILREMAPFLTAPVEPDDVLAVWCGIRPLVRDPKVLI